MRAVAFDADRLEVTSNPVPVLEGVNTKGSGAANFSLSSDGSLVYVSGEGAGGTRTLVWVDREGDEESLAADPRGYAQPDVSPEGGRVAVREGVAAQGDIWIYDRNRDSSPLLPFDPANEIMPRWSPDGQRVVFASNREGGTHNLFWKAADGTGAVERLTTSPNNQFPTSWSRDGQRLLFHEVNPDTQADLWVLSLEGEPTPELLLQTEFNEQHPALSPDGRWVAYQSNASGGNEVYVRPFPTWRPGSGWCRRTAAGSRCGAPVGRNCSI